MPWIEATCLIGLLYVGPFPSWASLCLAWLAWKTCSCLWTSCGDHMGLVACLAQLGNGCGYMFRGWRARAPRICKIFGSKIWRVLRSLMVQDPGFIGFLG